MVTPKNKDSVKETAPKAVEAVKAPVVKESVYSAEYLIANFKAFNTSPEVVAVALRLAGKKQATFAEARKIIETFKNKEVK